ncbi:DUF6531 domain-containing protein, partial [Pseudomonas aeruginosa]
MFDYFKSRTNWIESVEPVRRNDRAFDCFARGTDPSGSAHSGNVGAISRFGDSCPLGAEYNAKTGSCDCRSGYEMDDSGCKIPDKNDLENGPPPPEGCAGNPVNITNGNK